MVLVFKTKQNPFIRITTRSSCWAVARKAPPPRKRRGDYWPISAFKDTRLWLWNERGPWQHLDMKKIVMLFSIKAIKSWLIGSHGRLIADLQWFSCSLKSCWDLALTLNCSCKQTAYVSGYLFTQMHYLSIMGTNIDGRLLVTMNSTLT